ncbi:MAG: hypothetical protein DI543_03180 [Bradyrhizobium icense]|nr:MAG: hypothetical protein DI543_03180 [Bradyrhizobium icense]
MKKFYPLTTMPRETILAVDAGTPCHTGRAMAVTIAGEEVIVTARNLDQLNIVFNYIEANLRGGKAELMKTLRNSGCPKVAILPLDHRLKLDDEL